eukprot:Seg4498.2 transcript_id=Seg4498.2/GoldUCD/mRNA.D3Y31 product="hypothetical protein" protein_id=Seg4498.2/GoldUCD/D3Y31
MNNVEEELDKYKVKVDATKRTGKARELENHKIDLGLYSTSAKTCGFATENPVDWVLLFEKFYATHEQIKCDWKRISNQDGKYTEIQLFVTNGKAEKYITVHIHMTTGVVLIKGNFWKQWATLEFACFKRLIENKIDNEEAGVDIEEVPTHAFLEEICQKPVSNSNKKSIVKSGSNEEQTTEKQTDDVEESLIRGEDIHAEVEFLHKENLKIKERMSVLEKGLVDICKAQEVIKSEFQDHEVKVTKQLSQLDRSVEAKLQLYNEELKTEFKKELINMRNSLRDKINYTEESMKKQFVAIEESVSSKEVVQIPEDMNGMSQNINELENRIENIEVHLNKDTTYDQLNFEIQAQRTIIEKIQIESHKQVTIIEEQTKAIENLVKKVTDQHVGDRSRNELREEAKGDRGLAASQVQVTPPRDESFAAAVKYKSNGFTSEGLQTERVTSFPRNSSNVKEQASTRGTTKSLVVLMDSNRRYLHKDRLWRNCDIIPCNTISRAKELINTLHNDTKAVLIHTGVNDIESSPPEQVTEEIKCMIEHFQQVLPLTQLILSEITPRMDGLDRDVFQVNQNIRSMIEQYSAITLVKHHSLRKMENFRDNKHVSESIGVQRLAGNLKAGIRSAFGIQNQYNNRFLHQGTNQSFQYSSREWNGERETLSARHNYEQRYTQHQARSVSPERPRHENVNGYRSSDHLHESNTVSNKGQQGMQKTSWTNVERKLDLLTSLLLKNFQDQENQTVV